MKLPSYMPILARQESWKKPEIFWKHIHKLKLTEFYGLFFETLTLQIYLHIYFDENLWLIQLGLSVLEQYNSVQETVTNSKSKSHRDIQHP